VDTSFVKQFNATVVLLLQQKGSRLRGTVTEESMNSEEQFFEQIGATGVSEVTSRHGDSPLISTPHDRRRVTLRFFDTGDLVDSFDKVRMLIDPTSPYTQSMVYALGRAWDDVLLGGTDNPGEKNIGTFKDGTQAGAVIYGTAFSGKAGATSNTFPAGQKVAVNFGGTNVGLTVPKLLDARRIIKKGNVDLDAESLYIAVNAKGEADLLNTTQVTSADYNSVKALVGGDVDSFLGATFKRLERIPNDGTSSLYPLYVKSGLKMAIAKDIQTEVERRADKKFSWYVYACMGIGGVRMEEEKVVQIAGLL
jgi:hypothetical protein